MTLPTFDPSPADFRALFESVPTPFLVLLPDPDFTIVAVSDAYLRATMTTREGILGRGLFEVFPDNPDDPDASGERNLRASLARALATGAPDRMAVQKYDIPRRRGDGGFEERYWNPLNTPVFSTGGAISHILHYVEDVTEYVLLQRKGVEQKLVEAALRESREWLSTTLDSIGDAVIAAEVSGRVIFMNGVAEALTGWPAAEARGRRLDEVFVVVDEATGRAAPNPVERALATGEVQGFAGHSVLIARDGAGRAIDDSAAPIRDDRGRVRGVVLVFRDVSERVKAEGERERLAASIRESELRFRTLAESIPQLVWMARPDGHIVWYNQRWYDYTGTTPGQMEGWGWQSVHDPGVLPGVVERWKRSIDGGEPFEMVFPLRGADGRFRAFLTRVVPSRDDAGRVLVWFGTNTDVEDQKRAEAAIRDRAAQLRRLAEVATRINAAHDVESVVGVVTEEARSLIGAHLAATSVGHDTLHTRPVNAVSASKKYPGARRQAGPEGLALHGDVAATDRAVRVTRAETEGDPRWRHLADDAGSGPPINGWLAAPLVGRNGRRLGLIQLSDKCEDEFSADDEAVLVQLSQVASIAVENAFLYEELRANDRRKDEFLAMLAHELRNPLAAIGNAVTLTTRGGARDHIDWAMEVIGRQIRHLARLIDDLLDVSRISRGKIELRRELVDAAPILDGAVETVRPRIEERKHTLELAIDRGGLWVEADPTRLEQVVVNLLGNAAKYSENGGRIRLTAGREGQDVVVTVRDAGVGIAAAMLPQVFELFSQGDRSLARSEGGLGIGLTVVKKLVEMHGGTVVAKSEGVGKGSEFSVRLPAAGRPAGPIPAPAGPVAGAPVPPSRILVVDDNVDTARGMSRLLKLLGHDVKTAHSGPEAIEIARAYAPEFVLLDIGLPGMDGYEVAARLRNEDHLRDVVIIAVSGYGQDDDRRRSKEAGFDHHLVKPLDHDALLSLISKG